MSCMSVKGCTWEASSAARQAARNSTSVSGPNVVNVKEATRLQDACDFREHGIEILAPGQHQVAEDEIEAGLRQRQRFRLAEQPFDAR